MYIHWFLCRKCFFGNIPWVSHSILLYIQESVLKKTKIYFSKFLQISRLYLAYECKSRFLKVWNGNYLCGDRYFTILNCSDRSTSSFIFSTPRIKATISIPITTLITHLPTSHEITFVWLNKQQWVEVSLEL